MDENSKIEEVFKNIDCIVTSILTESGNPMTCDDIMKNILTSDMLTLEDKESIDENDLSAAIDFELKGNDLKYAIYPTGGYLMNPSWDGMGQRNCASDPAAHFGIKAEGNPKLIKMIELIKKGEISKPDDLKEYLTDNAPEVRYVAAEWAFLDIDKPSDVPLSKLFEDKTENSLMRSTVIQILFNYYSLSLDLVEDGHITKINPGLTPEEVERLCQSKINSLLECGLTDSDLRVRWTAVRLVETLMSPNKKTRELLVRLLEDPLIQDDVLRAAAEFDEVIPKLADWALSDDENLQQKGVECLNYKLSEPLSISALPILVDFFSTWDEKGLKDVAGLRNKSLLKEVIQSTSDSTDSFLDEDRQKLIQFCQSSDLVVQDIAFDCMQDKWLKSDLPVLENIDCDYDIMAPKEKKLRELVKLESDNSLSVAMECIVHRRQEVRHEANRDLQKLLHDAKNVSLMDEICEEIQNKIEIGKNKAVKYDCELAIAGITTQKKRLKKKGNDHQ